MPSFASVNYYLRTNKNVERKLIFEGIVRLSKMFDINEYRYIGFGSIWFVDFLIAHRLLGISDMVSIEKDNEGARRALFNRPFSCVSVQSGESSMVIPDLEIEERPLIAWLDYDGSLAQSTALTDIDLICSRAQSGSVVVITANAHKGQLTEPIPSAEDSIVTIKDILADSNSSETEKLRALEAITHEYGQYGAMPAERQRQRLNETFGDLVPADVQSKDFQMKHFPALLAKIVLNQFEHVMIKNGRSESFHPLFNFYYSDNAPMITVGGIIVNDVDAQKLEKAGIKEEFYVTGIEQFRIETPPLTFREKFALDRLLPQENLTADTIADKYEFSIRDAQLQAYQQLYKYYPIYGELEL